MANVLQYSRPGNPMDGGAQRATVHGVAELDATEPLTLNAHLQSLPVKFPGQRQEQPAAPLTQVAPSTSASQFARVPPGSHLQR